MYDWDFVYFFGEDEFVGVICQGEAAGGGVAKLVVKVLGVFVGGGGGHQVGVLEGFHLLFPVMDQGFSVAFSTVFFKDIEQVHERGVVPEEVVSEPAHYFFFFLCYIHSVGLEA